ncbi:hypothetical protein JZO70_00665 [Enterococcus sp. 669A]|uniref:Lipoprotein n=1 Tax=Candidatus Enterococcus moelleringii TaxID=2815325 RepID=A0ABS3L869_9ENTE|nr:hypothetical protein [Enterococcus sp. 669A]MBO1304654.1 hypothetical protein [Enterococcus sp. 669A]
MKIKNTLLVLLVLSCVLIFSSCKNEVQQIEVQNADFVLEKQPVDSYYKSAEYHLKNGELSRTVTIDLTGPDGRINIQGDIEAESRFNNLKRTIKTIFDEEVSLTEPQQTFSNNVSDVTLTIHLYGEGKGAFVFSDPNLIVRDNFHWMDGKPAMVSGEPIAGAYKFTSSEVDESYVYEEQLNAINNDYFFGDLFGRRIKEKDTWE